MADRAWTNCEFLEAFADGTAGQVVLVDEVPLVERRLSELGEMQRRLVEEKTEAAEQSGDNWHDGAFRATDDTAKVLGSQASVLFNARQANAVEMPDPTEDRLTLGSTVKLRQGSYEYSVQIVGVPALHEPVPDIDTCSIESPIARALIGLRTGDVTTVELGGTMRELKVLMLDQQSARETIVSGTD